MLDRLLNPLMSNNFFLFGARGTGKTTFLQRRFQHQRALWIDLLDPDQEDRYSRRPNELAEQISARSDIEWVVVDEIQKVPKLLDVIHGQIERKDVGFAMTGSSARRLKSETTNLLAGRAFVYNLYPLTHVELGEGFDLGQALEFGTLPGLLRFSSDEERNAFLRAYALTYLKEEVWAEHLLRKLDPFRSFLEVAAQCNGQVVNYSNVARDVGVDVKTVQSYFQILEDTLLGFMLEPFGRSVRRRQGRAPKFYLFDAGVKRALDRTLTVELRPGTYAFGMAFEHFLIIEMMRLNAYGQRDFRFSYLRTKDGAEIDLIAERPGRPPALIEIKSSERVDERDTRGLEGFLKDIPGAEGFCLSRDPVARKIGSVRALHWREGLVEMGLL